MSDVSQSAEPAPQKIAPIRRSSRIRIDVPLQVFTTKMTCIGRAHELGLTGMSIHVPLELVIGETVRLMFQMPGSRVHFGLFGTIRTRESFRYGIEFRELRTAERDELERVLNCSHPTTQAS